MRKLNSFGQEHSGPDHILSFLRRLRLDWLLHHFPPRLVRSLYVFVNGFITWGACPVGAREPQPICFSIARTHSVSPVFLSARQIVEPTKYYSGTRYRANLRLCSVRCHRRWNTTVRGASGIFWPRILAAALSLSATGAFMVLLDVSHPPAGATTLIVSLGIISKPRELVIIEVAVFLLVAQALVINRLAGLPYPFWRARASVKTNERIDGVNS